MEKSIQMLRINFLDIFVSDSIRKINLIVNSVFF